MRVLVAALIVSAAIATEVEAAESLWTVAIAGRREVVLTMRESSDGMPAADARLLGPELDLAVSAQNGAVTIRDANGAEWRTSNGALRLDGPIDSRPLRSPVQVMNDAVLLPLDAIAQLAGRTLVLEARGRAFLMPMSAPTRVVTAAPTNSATGPARSTGGDLRVPDGWQSFEVPKTVEEREAMAREEQDFLAVRNQPSIRESLPPRHEALGLDLGVGLAQYGGAAFDASGGGTIAGYRTNLAAFVTAGGSGATFRSGRVSVESPAGTWTTEAGDLLSEMRGLARGARYSRRLGSRWRPGVSLYVNDSRVPDDRAALAYRDSVLVTHNLDVRGEVSSDGSAFAGIRLIAGRGTGELFYRYSPLRHVVDRGTTVLYNIWRGIAAYGGIRVSDGDTRDHWNMIGVTLPLIAQSSVSVEQTRTTRLAASDTSNAFAFQAPIGPIRLIQRYQWVDVALTGGPSMTDSGRRQIQSMASYSPTNRLRFTYQTATQWYAGRDAQQWTELESVLHLSQTTSVHAVTGFPAIADPTRMRVGVRQALSRGFRLSVDYGRLPAFESSAPSAPDVSRLLVMVHHVWTVRTPARGADVEGVVRDDSGAAVAGVAVSLGTYLTTSREDGRYRFPHVPPGQYDLALVREHMLAAFAAADEQRTVVVADGAHVAVDLAVTALRAIHGRVFVDRNGDGHADDDEGVESVVVRLDDGKTATLTNSSGAFAFYNLEPGRYAVWIDRERLRSELDIVSPPRLDVDLQPEQATNNVDFRLGVHERPILMRDSR